MADLQIEKLRAELCEWLKTRESTLNEIERVADLLDAFQKGITAGRLCSGLLGVVGGALMLGGAAMAVATGGASLWLTPYGLEMVFGSAGGSVITEVADELIKRANSNVAQQALDKDKKLQVKLLDTFETFIDVCILDSHRKQQIFEKYVNVMDELQKLVSHSTRSYKYTKFATIAKIGFEGAEYGKLLLRPTIKKALTTSGIFMVVDLADVVRYSVEIGKGCPSEAAKALRKEGEVLKKERDTLVALFREAGAPGAF